MRPRARRHRARVSTRGEERASTIDVTKSIVVALSCATGDDDAGDERECARGRPATARRRRIVRRGGDGRE